MEAFKMVLLGFYRIKQLFINSFSGKMNQKSLVLLEEE